MTSKRTFCYFFGAFSGFKPIFHLANLFARREAKTRIRQRDWLKLAGEKNRREQVGSVPTFFVCSREQIRLVENGLYTPCFSHLSKTLNDTKNPINSNLNWRNLESILNTSA